MVTILSVRRRVVESNVRAMWRVSPLTFGVAILAPLAFTHGCSTYQPIIAEVSQAVGDWHRPMEPVDMSAGSKRAGTSVAESEAETWTSDEGEGQGHGHPMLTQLQGYMRDALERNPSAQAAVADAQAKFEQIAQATSLPDPLVRAVVRPESIRTAAGDLYLTIGVGQEIPLPARLGHAGRIAAADVRMAIERLNATRLRLITDVEQAYFRLYLIDRSVELMKAHQRSLEDLERVLETQYRVGKAEQHDLLRIQTGLAKLRDDESRLVRRRVSATAALNRLVDHPAARKIPTTGSLDARVLDADVEQLIALAAEHNPHLALLTHQTEREQEQIKLADLGHWPDPTIGFEWTYLDPRDAFEPLNAQPQAINRMSEKGTDSWALMLQLNVPIWFDRIEAAKRQARNRLLETQHKKQAAFNTVTTRIYGAWVQVQTRQDTIALLQSTIIPQARQTYDVSLTAYQAGTSDFLTVIDNWRRLLDFELMGHREIAELETAFSQLQHEVGLGLIRDEVFPDGPWFRGRCHVFDSGGLDGLDRLVRHRGG